MGIERNESIFMLHLDIVAVNLAIACEDHLSAGEAGDFRAHRNCNIDAVVEFVFAVYGVFAVTEVGSQRTINRCDIIKKNGRSLGAYDLGYGKTGILIRDLVCFGDDGYTLRILYGLRFRQFL